MNNNEARFPLHTSKADPMHSASGGDSKPKGTQSRVERRWFIRPAANCPIGG